MKRTIIMVKPALLLLTVLMFGACRQDAVFDSISNETPPVTPRIQGSPTNMVEFNQTLYIGQGGTLHSYDSAGWNKNTAIPRNPGGEMYGHALAATAGNLYAVASDKLQVISSGGKWTSVSGETNSSIRNVFSATGDAAGFVFAGKSNSDIYYMKDASSSLVLLREGVGIITGVAYNGATWYVTSNKGIHCFSSAPTYSTTILSGISFKGIININSASGIVAVAENGDYYEVSGTNANKRGSAGSQAQTALAVYRSPAGSFLLVGTENRGYREISLNSSGGITATVNAPGGSGSTVIDGNAYKGSLGQHPINYFMQFSGVIFASTVNQGLWSCRNGKWSAEQ